MGPARSFRPHLTDIARRWRLERRAGIVAGVVGCALVLGGIYTWFLVGVPIHDVHIYELAGDRLNAGGRLYDLRPEDPFPPGEGRTLPLFGPPGIAIPWRVLALLPGAAGVAIWLLVMTWLVLAAMFYVVLGTRGWVGAALIAGLAAPVVLVVGVGNVDAAIAALLLLAWSVRNRPLPLGAIIGSVAAIKLTPIVLVVWLMGTRRWRAVVWTAVAMTIVGVVTAAVTEPGIWLRYAGVALDVARAGRTTAVGIALIGSLIVVGLGRHRDGLAFALAVVLMPAGSPQSEVHSWAVVLAAFAPMVEWVGRRAVEDDTGVRERPALSRADTLDRADALA